MAKYKLISVDRITDPELPIREELTPESVSDLLDSISEVGIIEPIIVKKSGDYYEVVAGHRRFYAAKVLHLTEVPTLIVDVNGLDGEVLKLHENIARQEVSPLAWAKHLQRLIQQYDVDGAKIAEILGRSPAWVSQHLAILDYSPKLQAALEKGDISFTSARELASIKNPKTKEVYIDAAIRGGVTPALAIRWRKSANAESPTATDGSIPEPYQTPSVPTTIQFPVCPVCNDPIEPHEHLTLTIHDRCQPKT